MAAVISEAQAGDVLVVTGEDSKQPTCGHLSQPQRRNRIRFLRFVTRQRLIKFIFLWLNDVLQSYLYPKINVHNIKIAKKAILTSRTMKGYCTDVPRNPYV